MKKRDITLTDETENSVRLTLWNDKAEQFAGLNQVIAAKQAKVSEWNGNMSLSLSFSGSVEENPDVPETQRLLGWFQNEADRVALARSNSSGRSNATASGDVVSLGEMKLDYAGSTQTRYFTVEAYVSALTSFSDGSIAYKSCPVCKKKLQEKSEGSASSKVYRCPKCNADRTEVQLRYLLRFLLADATDHTWASAFDEVGSTLFGAKAEEVAPLRDSDPLEYQRKVADLQHSRFRMRVSCRTETFNDESRMKVTVESAEKVDEGSQDRITYLRGQIEKVGRELGCTDEQIRQWTGV